MSLPAKGSRRLTVDGAEYRWRVRRRPTADQRTGRTPLLLAIARADGAGASLVVRLCQAHPSNTARLRGEAVTPGVVAAWIRTGIGQGWRPDRPGPQVLLSGRDHATGRWGVRTVPRGPWAPSTEELERLARRPPGARDRFELRGDHPVEWPEGGGCQPARIRINGVDLVELARDVAPHDHDEGPEESWDDFEEIRVAIATDRGTFVEQRGIEIANWLPASAVAIRRASGEDVIAGDDPELRITLERFIGADEGVPEQYQVVELVCGFGTSGAFACARFESGVKQHDVPRSPASERALRRIVLP